MKEFTVSNYNLAATLESGQAFRWRRAQDAWEGVVTGRWVRLRQSGDTLLAESSGPPGDWAWLRHYLQLDADLAAIHATFPDDAPMRCSLRACPGLRLLRQEPWECLASFICSSTKQIVQIQQIIALLGERLGRPVPVPEGAAPAHSFPDFQTVARASEAELRACKLGFRAPYLLGTARLLDGGTMNLDALHGLSLEEARAQLLQCPGVGPKIADCVLLFGYGFGRAFPVDVWVFRALRELYFKGRRVKPARLLKFRDEYFGPHAGYAQQYLFHYMRTQWHPEPR